MLEIKNLTKRYGKLIAVDNISLEISKGEIFGFIGPNGAGKTTTIKCIMNLINKDSGEILIEDNPILFNDYLYKENIGYLPSELSLYKDLKVKDYLKYNASFYKNVDMNYIKELCLKLELETNKKVEELSLGNEKKLGIICALMHRPKLLILDEPTSGLDPISQNVFYELLNEEKNRGTTIFFSSHNLGEVKKICDRVAIIKAGKIIKLENIQKLQSEYLTVKIYSKHINKILKELNTKIMEKSNDYIKIMYDKDINTILKVLTKYDIVKLLIEEPNLEDIFMHYYKEDK